MTAWRRRVGLACRLAVGGVFLYAGALKLGDPGGFAQEIANYRLLPAALVGPVALALPGMEVAAGAALVTGVALRGGIVLIEAMLAVFVVGLVQAVGRGIDISCGCFGAASGERPIGWIEVVRDLVLMAAAAAAWPSGAPRDSPQARP